MATQPAGQHGADDIEETDHSQRPAADLGREPAIDQIRGQMQSDETELESAGEETQHEQEKRAVPEGLGQSLTIGLRLQLARRGFPTRAHVGGRSSDRKREWNDQKQKAGEDLERHSPADRIDQAYSQWREQELAE